MPRFFLTLFLPAAAIAAMPISPSVSLDLRSVSLPEAIAAFKKQSGISLVSELRRDVPPITLRLPATSPWMALDALAARLDAEVLPPSSGGALRLVSLAPGAKPLPTSYDGPFRFRIQRVVASRDLDTSRGDTLLVLEASWLPGTRPLFLDGTPHDVQFHDTSGKRVDAPAATGAPGPVDGRFSSQVEVKLPVFPRADARIGLVEGKLNAILPTEMLSFPFDASIEALSAAKPGGEQRSRTRSGVTCRLEGISLGRDRWTFRVALDYPRGNRSLESWQAGSMVVFNELRLTTLDGKRTLLPTGSSADAIGTRRVVVTYHFTDGGASPRNSGSWRLAYTAPAQIVDAKLKFSFKNVPLP